VRLEDDVNKHNCHRAEISTSYPPPFRLEDGGWHKRADEPLVMKVGPFLLDVERGGGYARGRMEKEGGVGMAENAPYAEGGSWKKPSPEGTRRRVRGGGRSETREGCASAARGGAAPVAAVASSRGWPTATKAKRRGGPPTTQRERDPWDFEGGRGGGKTCGEADVKV
jgi:hypothetical protein